MLIGILGAGSVGAALGRRFARLGHEVMYSSRDPDGEAVQALAAETSGSVGTVAETVAFGETIVVALPGDGALEACAAVEDWSGKVVVDAVNVVGAGGVVGSISSDLASATGAPLAKAFNTIGWEVMESPLYDGEPAVLLVCGHDAAKAAAAGLGEELGFEVLDVGGLDREGILAAMCQVWVGMMIAGIGREFAFKYLHR